MEPLIYQSSLDFRAVEAVSETRQRISEKVAAKRDSRGGLDIKLTPGGIRDIEFLVQCLQRLHGGREPWVRHGGTMLALFRLRDKGLLSDAEYARLAAAYQFLRYLEHRLQMEDDRQTHTLARPIRKRSMCWRARCPKRPAAPGRRRRCSCRLDEHRPAVQEIYERVIHAQQAAVLRVHRTGGTAAGEGGSRARRRPSNLTRSLDQRAPRLADAVADAESAPRAGALRAFSGESVRHARPARAAGIAMPSSSAAVLDIFEHSPYFADELLRYPELLDEIGEPFCLEGGPLPDGAALRRFYRRQMLRIQSESILGGEPIFDTLAQDLGAGRQRDRGGLPRSPCAKRRRRPEPPTGPATR